MHQETIKKSEKPLEDLQELEQALLYTSSTWMPNITIQPEASYEEQRPLRSPTPHVVEQSDAAENAHSEQSPPICPEALKRLMEAIGGNRTPKKA